MLKLVVSVVLVNVLHSMHVFSSHCLVG